MVGPPLKQLENKTDNIFIMSNIKRLELKTGFCDLLQVHESSTSRLLICVNNFQSIFFFWKELSNLYSQSCSTNWDTGVTFRYHLERRVQEISLKTPGRSCIKEQQFRSLSQSALRPLTLSLVVRSASLKCASWSPDPAIKWVGGWGWMGGEGRSGLGRMWRLPFGNVKVWKRNASKACA